MDIQRLERSTLSRQSKEKGHPFPVWCVLSAMEHIFNETAMQARTQASKRQANAIKASHGPSVSPQSQAQEKVKKTMEIHWKVPLDSQRCDPSFQRLRER